MSLKGARGTETHICGDRFNPLRHYKTTESSSAAGMEAGEQKRPDGELLKEGGLLAWLDAYRTRVECRQHTQVKPKDHFIDGQPFRLQIRPILRVG